MTEALKLFIICPINSETSKNRKITDYLKRFLIDPAIKRMDELHGVKIHAEIDHHDLGARDIVQGIVRKILSYDFIIAFIYNSNPNVFYELGIAHSAGRDVIIVFEQKTGSDHLPFDIATKAAIPYKDGDLEDWKGNESCASREEAVSNVYGALLKASASPSTRVAFGAERFDALGSRHSKYILHDRFTESLPYNSTVAMEFFDAATSYIALMGVSLFQLTDHGDTWKTRSGESIPFMRFMEAQLTFKPILLEIFIMHPDNPVLPQMLKTFVDRSDESDDQVVRVRDEIAAATNQWSRFVARVNASNLQGRARLVRLRRGIPYNRISLTDQAMIVTPYFYRNTTSGTGPALQVTSDTSLYRLIRNDLDFLKSAPTTEIYEGVAAAESA